MNYPRRKFEMTQADLDKILDACKPTPCIMIGNYAGRSRRENANRAWAELGQRMGFDSLTVKPTGEGNRFFTAEPTELEADKAARLAREHEEQLQADIARMEQEIKTLQDKMASCLNELVAGKATP